MNPSELAEKMLKWEKDKRALDQLAAEIEAAVLLIGKTQVVGGCRVKYSTGRATYDYQTPAAAAAADIIKKNTVEMFETDWKKACEIAKVDKDIITECTLVLRSIDYREICKEANIKPLVLGSTLPSAKIMLESDPTEAS